MMRCVFQVDDCFTGPNGMVSGTTLGPRDAGNASLTTIGTGDAPKEGALFLITGQV